MTTKHTPGPWVVGTTDGHDTYNVTGPRGALPYIARIPGDRLERGANARLIGAAPELLAALRAMLATVHDEERDDATVAAVAAARAAIATATGEA